MATCFTVKHDGNGIGAATAAAEAAIPTPMHIKDLQNVSTAFQNTRACAIAGVFHREHVHTQK